MQSMKIVFNYVIIIISKQASKQQSNDNSVCIDEEANMSQLTTSTLLIGMLIDAT